MTISEEKAWMAARVNNCHSFWLYLFVFLKQKNWDFSSISGCKPENILLEEFILCNFRAEYYGPISDGILQVLRIYLTAITLATNTHQY